MFLLTTMVRRKAQAKPSLISCAGATDYLGFEQLDGDWDTYVDGVFYPSPYDPAATIREHLSDIINAQNDGFADFWNIDTTAPHRIKFVPRNNTGNPNSYILREENTNQSFAELEDGSLVFCLTQKSCEPSLHTITVTNLNTSQIYTTSYRINGGDVIVSKGYPRDADGSDGSQSPLTTEPLLALRGALCKYNPEVQNYFGFNAPELNGYAVDDANGQGSIDVELLVTEPSEAEGVDLVALLFGENITMHSCSFIDE